MSLFIQVIIFVFSLLVLAKSSSVTEHSAVKISKITGLGDIVIGFILLSLISNLPELSIAISSLTADKVNITLGNIFGSNVSDLLFVLGIASLIGAIKVTKRTFHELSAMLFIASAVPLLLLSKFYSPRLIGFILIIIFAYFVYYSIRNKIIIKHKKNKHKKTQTSTILAFLLSVVFVIISARFVVESASNIAAILDISEAIIGATILSIGTTLPELSIAFYAVKEKHYDLALGNVIGACLVTPTLILGIVLLVNPISIDFNSYSILLGFLIFSSLIAWIFFGRGKLERFEGVFLLVLYIIFIIIAFIFELM